MPWYLGADLHRAPHSATSLRFVPEKHRKKVAADLRPIYTAIDADHAADALEAFDREWGERYPMITRTWRQAGSS